MSTPLPPPTPQAPVGPPPEAQGSSKRGCIIACIVVLLVLLAGCFGACWYAKQHVGDVMKLFADFVRQSVEQSIAADVPDSVKDEAFAELDALVGTFQTMKQDIESGKLTQEEAEKRAEAAMEAIQLLAVSAQDGSVTQEDLEKFMEASRAARGADGS